MSVRYNEWHMEWDVPEYHHEEKDSNWFAAAIVLAGALVAVEFMFNQFVLIALTITATTALFLVAKREPNMMRVEIKKTGIRAGSMFYPFANLDGFAVIDHPNEHKILLESTKAFMPIIVVPVARDIDLDVLHDQLAEFLPSKDLREPVGHVLFERLGF